MDTLNEITDYASLLKLPYLKENLLKILDQAKATDQTYQEFLITILRHEMNLRDTKLQERRLKNASFPVIKTLDAFDLNFQKSMSKRDFNELSELTWIDRIYNLILLGPPGVGKTHLAIALG